MGGDVDRGGRAGGRRAVAGAVAILAVAIVAGCTSTTPAATGTSPPTPAPTVPLSPPRTELPPLRDDLIPGTTGAVGGVTTVGPPVLPGAHPDTLEGMRGVSTAFDLPLSWRDRLRTVDPGLLDTPYAAETYDAVVVLALAAAKAGATGTTLGAEVIDVTRGGTVCTSAAACLKVIAEGGDPDYDGVSGRLELGPNGDPSEGRFAVLRFGADNRLDPALTTYRTARTADPGSVAPPRSLPTPTRKNDGVFRLGSLLPLTGTLTYLRPAMTAGFRLAVADVNAAGGVSQRPIETLEVDAGDSTNGIAVRSATALLAAGVDAVVGPSSSAVALSVLGSFTSAGVPVVSPSATSRRLATFSDRNLFFRTTPSDIVQAAALADLIIEDGAQRVGVLASEDLYANGLATDLKRELEARGSAVAAQVGYSSSRRTFDDEVNAVRRAEVDAVVVCGFEESSFVLRALAAAGMGPGRIRVYGCDGNMTGAVGRAFAEGT